MKYVFDTCYFGGLRCTLRAQQTTQVCYCQSQNIENMQLMHAIALVLCVLPLLVIAAALLLMLLLLLVSRVN